MCGICGIINYNGRPVDQSLLKKMTALLEHRGPDDEGYYIGNQMSDVRCQIGLGVRRLGVIDLETGHQPVHNEDKSVWIICDGLIYNFLQLKKDLRNRHRFYTKTDTEVIVHLYEEHGIDCLKYIRGAFAFAIWDENKNLLFIARDRLGQKPLYYTWIDGNFYFASEIKSFLEIPGFKKEINLQAIHYYLTYQFIPAPMTIWKNIFALKPARNMIVDEKRKVNIEKYWSIDFTKKTQLSFGQAKDRIKELLKESTRLRMISDVPLGAFLSGGHDSTIIVGLMSEISSRPVKTFTMGFKEKEFSELEYARAVAKRFNTDHQEFIIEPKFVDILPEIVWHYDQPYADCSALPSYYLAKMTGNHVKVALTGDGGDENFAGYLKYKALKVSNLVSPVFKFIPDVLIDYVLNKIPMNESVSARKSMRYLHRFMGPIKESPAVKNILWRAYFGRELKNYIYSEEMKEKAGNDYSYQYQEDMFNSAPANSDFDRMLYTDIMSYLADELTVKMDIACMANSLEVRSPFMDHNIFEFTSTLPAKWKLKGLKSKYILKEAFKDYFPKEIINRGKQGFSIPLGKWFRTELKDYLKDTVLSVRALNRGYFNPKNLKLLIDSHIEGKKDYGYCLWALLMLELWHRVFVDRDS